MIEPITSNPVLFDVVYQRLMEAIIDCTLLPGQRIRQAELAASLGVSRAPVSHALQVLKHQGLLRDSGRKGLEVVAIDPDRVRDLYQVRAALDGLAARMAAQRAADGQLSAADADRLQATFDVGMGLSKDVAMSKRVGADIDFHRMIHRISGNQAIREALEPLWPHLQRAMVLVLDAHARRDAAWSDHRRVLQAILAGDPDAASEAARSHADQAGLRTADRLRLSHTERAVSDQSESL